MATYTPPSNPNWNDQGSIRDWADEDRKRWAKYQADSIHEMFHPAGGAPAPRYGNGGQPYFQPGGFRNLRAALWAAIYGPIMLRIGRNWADKSGSWQYGMQRAIVVAIFWKAWVFGCFWWMLTNYTVNSEVTTDVTMICKALNWFLVLPALGVVYCKLIDKSLFKHRFAYKVFNPIRKLVNWCPWPVLLSLALVPAFFYLQMRYVQVPDSVPGYTR